MRTHALKLVAGAAFAIASAGGVAAQGTASPLPTATHAAVGSYFGKAIELCAKGVAPSACSIGGTPALALYMTPTLLADGDFIGNDSFALGAPPFGPHTTAHGRWIATSPTDFSVDYTFMLNAYPPQGDNAIQGVRFRWLGTVVDANTLQGYVNMYFSAPVVPDWSNLGPNDFPLIPSSASVILTHPPTFYTDPTLCNSPANGCPLVFKFTVKRVTP